MTQNLMQESTFEDELDLRDLIKILIESKKLIIASILIFSIAGLVYSLSLKDSFTSSAHLEIGYYERPDGSSKLIESPSDIISELKILIVRNPDNKFSQDQEVSIESFERKAISLKTTSASIENNEKILNELISHTVKKHSKILELITNTQYQDKEDRIGLIKDEIAYLEKMIQNNPDANLEDQVSINKDIFNLKKELSTLENILSISKTQAFRKTQTFQDIVTKTNEEKIAITIFLGLIFGLITGIVLALIRNFVKRFKEIKA